MKNSSIYRSFLPAIIIFILVIVSVGTIQAIKEIREKKDIQALNLLEDSFLTPFEKRTKAVEILNKLQKSVDTLTELSSSENFKQINKIAEALTYAAEDLRKIFEAPNRYIQIDTTNIRPKAILKVAGICAGISDRWYSKENTGVLSSALNELQHQLVIVQNQIKSSGLWNGLSLITNTLLKTTLFSQKYLRKWESEIETNSLIAGWLRSAMSWLQFKIFRETTEKVVEGKDGWFFYKRGIDYLVKPYMTDQRSLDVDANDKPYFEDPLKAVINFRDQLKAKGIDLLVVMLPGKASIYPEYLSSRVSSHEVNSNSNSRRFLSELKENNVEFVDIHASLLQARMAEEPGKENLFLKKDTHWRSRGLRVTAKAIAEKIKSLPGIVDSSEHVEYILDTVFVNRNGDILEMTKLMSPDLDVFKINFEGEPELCYQVYKAQIDSAGNLIKGRRFKNDFRNSNILMLGDSFSRIYQSDAPTSAGLISHLAYELKVPLASIVSNGGASTLVRQKLARKKKMLKGKKLVVWEFVERDLRYGEEGWKDVNL